MRCISPARAALLTAFAIAALAAPAGAATVSRDADGTLVVTGAPGEQNRVVIGAATDDTAGWIHVSDRNDLAITAEGCAPPLGTALVNCRVDPAGVRIELGDGDDAASVGFDLPAAVPVTINGGPGADSLTGDRERDVFDGGDGNDTIDGRGGADVVFGGAGDDTLMGDHFEDAAPDVVDGGPGTDTFAEDWTDRHTGAQPDIALTLAGGADDGRPGEGDDVHNVEAVTVHQGGTLTGTDAPERLEAFQTIRTVHLAGAGGNDDLRAGGGNDTVDGGAGDDHIDAGFGDDTIVGGPGRDAVFGDRQGGDCGPIWCITDYGNDTIDVRDGEIDTVDCGAGLDSVQADAGDVIAPDCETVTRVGAPVSAAKPSGTPTKHRAAAKRCRVPRVVGLTATHAKQRLAAAGCRARLAGHGRRVARQSVRAGRQVARGTKVTLKLRA